MKRIKLKTGGYDRERRGERERGERYKEREEAEGLDRLWALTNRPGHPQCGGWCMCEGKATLLFQNALGS
jgi:hypothetical protein